MEVEESLLADMGGEVEPLFWTAGCGSNTTSGGGGGAGDLDRSLGTSDELPTTCENPELAGGGVGAVMVDVDCE